MQWPGAEHQLGQGLAADVARKGRERAALVRGLEGPAIHAHRVAIELGHVHAQRHHIEGAARSQLEIMPCHHRQGLALAQVPAQVPGLPVCADGHAQRDGPRPALAVLQHGLVGGFAEQLHGAQAQGLETPIETTGRHLLVALLPVGQQRRMLVHIVGLVAAVVHEKGVTAPGMPSIVRADMPRASPDRPRCDPGRGPLVNGCG